MKRLMFVTTLAAFGAGFASPALANYFWPGRIIIGTGISGGGGTTAMNEGCVIKPAIECECFPGMPVLEACHASQVETFCLTPATFYQKILQEEEVLVSDGSMTLGGLRCGEWSAQTAFISLPNLGVVPPKP